MYNEIDGDGVLDAMFVYNEGIAWNDNDAKRSFAAWI